MKRVTAFVLCLLLISLSVAASPASNQIIKLTAKGDVLNFVATEPTTYWESPALRAGETAVINGTLTLINETDSPRNIYFENVKFPYQDAQALEYLNHLLLTVKQGDTVVYDGAYSCINNPDVKPQLGAFLEPQASCSYTISLRCDYTYTDEHYLGAALLEWTFSVETDPAPNFPTEETEKPPLIFDPLFWQWPIALVLAAVIFLVVSRSKKN